MERVELRVENSLFVLTLIGFWRKSLRRINKGWVLVQKELPEKLEVLGKKLKEWALALGVHLGISDVDVEWDSRAVIQKLQGESMDRSEIAAYIADSKKLLSHFRSCVFIFQNREANDAAHNIASEGIIRGENAYLSHRVSEGGVDLMMAERR
ncbi:protein disulfide isomerase-like 1-4 [Gossypium australe]|uniref:Protein disulfide isomerase-like 1-4 n=1 Tax=Gossypium australe TaxID=47621 RepID=A0A5B6VK13_9ROSI|nr:protein disulfide isomerase-like 1-4 [Gossypium australe]